MEALGSLVNTVTIKMSVDADQIESLKLRNRIRTAD